MRLNDDKMLVYSRSHWSLLETKRREAREIMTALSSREITSSVYGSVTRGDVHPESDVDIIIPYVISSHSVELALTMKGFKIYSKNIAQATPRHALKGHIYVDADEKNCVTFPLVPFRGLELEFYIFGGLLTLPTLIEAKRVPGCNKGLMFIQPTEQGHNEFSIVGREVEVAKILEVSLEIVQERVKILTRRKDLGRTGIVIFQRLEKDDVFEDVLRQLEASNPLVRRKIRKSQ